MAATATRRRTTSSRRRTSSERGAVAIMVAISMTALVIAVAMVLDFGVVRLDRQDNKAAADVAAAAGIRGVEGVDGSVKPYRGVCQAVRYLKANGHGAELNDLSGSWRTGAGTAVSGNPCDPASPLQSASCVPGTPSSWAWYSGTAAGGRIRVDVKSGYRLSDGGWPEESLLTGDNGDPSQDGCDQVAVMIQETRGPGLGSLVTGSDLGTRIRSVARASVGEGGQQALLALLLLERHDCLALDIQGSSGARVLVRGAGGRPGMIHSDSLGNGGLCTGSDKIIDGDFESPPRIWAEDAETGSPLAPGVIGITALTGAPGAVPGNAHDPSPTMVFAEGQPNGAPMGQKLVTRKFVDQRYREPVIDTIATASSRWGMSPTSAAAAGYTVLGCTPPGASVTASLVYVDCPGGITYTSNFTFSGANATVVFNGPVEVAGTSGTTVSFSDARNVFVKGSSTAGVRVTRNLRINAGGQPTCADRFAANRSARTKFVIGAGPLVAQGESALRMCQTAIVLAHNDGTCPIPATNGIAPYNNTCSGYIDVRGGGGLDWTAPNATSSPPTLADIRELEDLAVWSETAGNGTLFNRVEGSGALVMQGVFFLPNAKPFRIAGQGGQRIGENAQFIARRLEVAGSGRLDMRPNPNDIVPIPYFGDFRLVR